MIKYPEKYIFMFISWIYHPIMQWYAFFRFNNPPSESMVNNSKDASRFWRLWREDANACHWHWFLFNYLRFIVFFWAKQLPEYGIYLSSYQPTHFNTKFKSRKVENAQQLSDRNIKQREEKWKFIVWDN